MYFSAWLIILPILFFMFYLIIMISNIQKCLKRAVECLKNAADVINGCCKKKYQVFKKRHQIKAQTQMS